MMLLASLARNSAARAKFSGDQRLAFWLIMACAAAGRGVVVAEVDEDPAAGKAGSSSARGRRRVPP
jgi:hypothetical protein